MSASPPLKEIDEVEEYLFKVRELCGELCDYSKEVVPGKLLGTVSSKVSSIGSLSFTGFWIYQAFCTSSKLGYDVNPSH